MSDEEIPAKISEVREKYGIIIDPHTACAFKDLPDSPAVVLSTASPAKFPELIKKTLGIEPKSGILESLKRGNIVKTSMPADAEKIRAFLRERAIR